MAAMDRASPSRRLACLAAFSAALFAPAVAQAAGAGGPGFSLTPSTSEPYAACGRATPRHAACLAVLVPSQLPGSAQVNPHYTGSGVGGGYAPADLRSAYNLPSATAGSGQTVAIVDAFDDPNAEADLAKYRSQYGLSACTAGNGCFRKVNQSGGSTYPLPDAGWAVEISLDLDMASAACPNCHVLLVEASTNSFNDLATAENQAVTLGATEVSNSWAGEEFAEETSLDSNFHHPGVPITVSAGDLGYGVEYPAASPYVIAVGGTSLNKASNSRGWSETAWTGTGSGCSAYEPKPAWQTDKGCAQRTNTDVSAVADPKTPVSVADTYKLPAEFSKPAPGWTLVGGTSASSPLIAGTMALANAYTRSFAGAAALYTEAAQNGTGALDDVLSGSNGSCGNYLCNAGPGYDGPTGLGSPYGAPLDLEPPHYFSGGLGAVARTGPEAKIPVVSWGTLSLTNLTTGAKVTCKNVITGIVENPAPGGSAGPAGLGETQSFNPYECESEACTPAATKSGAATYMSVRAEGTEAPLPATGNETNLRWRSHLLTEGAQVRTETEGIKLDVICHLNTAFNGAGEPIFGAVVEEKSEGSDKPSLILKCCKASSPPEAEFDPGSGTLHRPSPEEATKSKTEGRLKMLGYNEEEIVNTKAG
jgi:Subtilase family